MAALAAREQNSTVTNEAIGAVHRNFAASELHASRDDSVIA
jgi:hypothetical protein